MKSRAHTPFSSRHRQQIEAGRPITVSTLLRICHVFNCPMERGKGVGSGDVFEAAIRDLSCRHRPAATRVASLPARILPLAVFLGVSP